MKDKQSEELALQSNLPTLTNAVEAVAQVVERVAGNAISNTIGGRLATISVLQQATAARFQSLINAKLGAL